MCLPPPPAVLTDALLSCWPCFLAPAPVCCRLRCGACSILHFESDALLASQSNFSFSASHAFQPAADDRPCPLLPSRCVACLLAFGHLLVAFVERLKAARGLCAQTLCKCELIALGRVLLHPRQAQARLARHRHHSVHRRGRCARRIHQGLLIHTHTYTHILSCVRVRVCVRSST